MSKFQKGHKINLGKKRPPRSKEWSDKISKAKSGNKHPNWGKHHSEETKKKMSESRLNGNMPDVRGSLNPRWKGGINKPKCVDCGKQIWAKRTRCKPCRGLFFMGNKAPNWKGGVHPLIGSIRTSLPYRQWRSDVFTRDKFTCQDCGDNTGGNLNAHHIKFFIDIIKQYNLSTLEQAFQCEELWNINNGVTLCKNCHKNIHKKHE